MHDSTTLRTSQRKPLALALLALVAAAPLPALATLVTSCEDDGGFDTLRHAITVANSGDTIDLTQLQCSKITLTGELDVTIDDLTINGPGRDRLTIDAAGNDRAIMHYGVGNLTLNDLTIANGKLVGATAYGGCIYSHGSVYLSGASVTNCQALGDTKAAGGGIVAVNAVSLLYSSVTNNTVRASSTSDPQALAVGGGMFGAKSVSLISSVVSGNSASADGSGKAVGGGLTTYNLGAKYTTVSGNSALGTPNTQSVGGGAGMAVTASAFVVDTTIDHNTADVGGGMYIGSIGNSSSVIVQTTISSNTANRYSGGLITQGTTTIANSTIAFNTGGLNGQGGGFTAVDSSKKITLQASIVADNVPLDVYANQTIDGSNNIVKTKSANAVLPADTIKSDPLLGPLAYNGGITRTHAPDAASPAIDKGILPYNFGTDQRGPTYLRPVGPADIGAIEYDADHIFGDAFGAATLGP